MTAKTQESLACTAKKRYKVCDHVRRKGFKLKSEPQVIHLKDYEQPNYWAKKTNLVFDLYEDHAVVISTVTYERNGDGKNTLNLVGLEQELQHVKINKKLIELDDLDYSPEHLNLKNLPDHFDLELVTKLYPSKNTALEGLYKSNGKFCTQCEPEGFRRITYYLDRPDVMSEYQTTIIADKGHYPILLSNGNPIESRDLKPVSYAHLTLTTTPYV